LKQAALKFGANKFIRRPGPLFS